MSGNMQERRQQYDEIMKLYDYADELAATIESEFVDSAQNQLSLVEPLILQIEESTDVMTDEFINLADGKDAHRSRGGVEKALRKIYTAIDDYSVRLHGSLKNNSDGIKNIADAIILKLKEKLEDVVIVFLHYTKLSLDRVMHKQELEEIKRNQQYVSFQLHNMSQHH